MSRRKIGSLPVRTVGHVWSDIANCRIPSYEYAEIKDKPGIIYVFHAGGYYKIGSSSGDIKERLKQLAVGCPVEMTIVHSFPCNHMPSAEAELHRMFRDNHVRGEWFRLTRRDVQWLLAVRGIVRDTIMEMQDGFPNHAKNIEWVKGESI